jgi:hypothetical protein
MTTKYDETEEFWAAILSENRDEVKRAWQTLAADERVLVMAHLQKMRDPDEGYAEVQRAAAQFAVDIVGEKPS